MDGVALFLPSGDHRAHEPLENSQRLLTIAAIVGMALAPWLAHAAEQPQARPNIVLIIGDDQGYLDYGFMGHPVIKTPNLDKLASEGLLYTRGYVPTALCCPSLGSFLTGMYPHQHGFTGNDPKPPADMGWTKERDQWVNENKGSFIEHFRKRPQLPRELRKAGYVSLHTGKYWYGTPENSGFTHKTKGSTGRHGGDSLIIGRETMQPIYDFIETAQKEEKSFFVWYAPFLPHMPHNPPQRLFKKYQGKAKDDTRAKYFAMCEWLDETVGDLLKHLDEKGLRDNTLILYISDNGWDGGVEGFRGAKFTPWELGVRQPIIINWRGKVKPRRDETNLASGIDFAPTVLAACGLKAPEEMKGIDLLDDAAVVKRDTIFLENSKHDMEDVNAPEKTLGQRSVIWKHWKLVDAHGQKDFLFDLEKNAKETTNLLEQHPEIVTELRGKLDAWWPESKGL